MLFRTIPLFLAATFLCLGADDAARGSNENMEIQAKVYPGKDAVKGLLGNDLDGFICVVEVKVVALTEKPVTIRKEDFFLKSNKDGQRSQPFAPSQIAGRGAMVVSRTGGGGIMGDSGGPIWGGMGGPIGRGPGDGGVIGNAGDPGENSVKINAGDKEKANPLLTVLKEKELPEKETKDTVSGYLYFPLEGKHKPKDLELMYKGSAGKVTVEFR